MITTMPLEKMNLLKRVELGVNFLSKNIDTNKGCLPYFFTFFKDDPAEARHDWPDFGDLTARYVEALIMARRMLGKSELYAVELKLRDLLVSYFDDGDGLSYRPLGDKPYYSTILKRMYNEHVAEGFDQARVLWALIIWYEETGDQEVFNRIQELLEGLDRVVVKRDDWGYYDRFQFEPGCVVLDDAEAVDHQYYFCGTQIHPLIECYERLGIELAGELAQRLSNFIMYHSDYFGPKGQWHCKPDDKSWLSLTDGHTHSRFATIAGVAKTGMLRNDANLFERARICYDWFVENHCSEFGWSPEFVERHGDENEGCETCAVMDQINCCLVFAQNGYPEFYEKLEKISRNQLLENQLIDTSLVRNTVNKETNELSCFTDVADMVRGGFAGWSGPNDFIGNCANNYCLMNCCGPAGIRAIYDVWNNIYSFEDGVVTLNVLMDKEDENISLEHKQPIEGLIRIELKQSCKLRISKRSWLDERKMIIKADGKVVKTECDSCYILIGSVNQGTIVEVFYELQENVRQSHVNGRDFKVCWIGDTVVEIDPAGKFMPFYKDRRNKDA